jgi:hypothetical protein
VHALELVDQVQDGFARSAALHLAACEDPADQDSALRLNVHAHTLVLDGVYIRNAGSAELHFESLPALSYGTDMRQHWLVQLELGVLRLHGV